MDEFNKFKKLVEQEFEDDSKLIFKINYLKTLLREAEGRISVLEHNMPLLSNINRSKLLKDELLDLKIKVERLRKS